MSGRSIQVSKARHTVTPVAAPLHWVWHVARLLRNLPRAKLVIVLILDASLGGAAAVASMVAAVTLAGAAQPSGGLPPSSYFWLFVFVFGFSSLYLIAPLSNALVDRVGGLALVTQQTKAITTVHSQGFSNSTSPSVLEEIESARLADTGPWPAPASIRVLHGCGMAAMRLTLYVALSGMTLWWTPILVLASWVAVNLVLADLERLTTTALLGGDGMRRYRYMSDLVLQGSARDEVRARRLWPWLRTAMRRQFLTAAAPIWARRRAFVLRLMPCAVLVLIAYVTAVSALVGLAQTGAQTVATTTIAVLALVGISEAVSPTRLLGVAAASRSHSARPPVVSRGSLTSPPTRDLAARNDDAVVVDDVWYRHPGTEDWLLRGLNGRFAQGTTTLLFGPNGAGKTTFCRLVVGVAAPSRGSIAYPLTWASPGSARNGRRTVYLPQDFLRLPLSVRDNVLLGTPSFSMGDDAIWWALEAAGLTDYVSKLSNGLDTVLAAGYQSAVPSSGLWQRIALARVFAAISAGCQFVVLDEPTATLDRAAEERFFDRYTEIAVGVTTIIVSHRLVSASGFDGAYRMRGGRLHPWSSENP